MSWRSPRVWLLLAFPLVAAVGACAEDLEVGQTCPLLCPGQDIEIRDTVLDPAYELDTTLVGFPIQGLESPLLLATRSGLLDTRIVIRFDTLVRRYIPPGGDTLEPITEVNSAVLSFRIASRGLPVPSQFIIEAYDVFDPLAPDTLPAALLPLFTNDRLLGNFRTTAAAFQDTVRVELALDGPRLTEIVADPERRLRIGLRLQAPEGGQFVMTPYLPGGDGPRLDYRVDRDTTVPRVAGLQPSSFTPTTPTFVAGDFVDYSIIAEAPDLRAPGTFHVGGLPGARAYLRFNIPSWLTDSVAILRARLELTQDPIPGADADTVTLLPHLVVANSSVTDLRRAATLLTGGNLFTNTLRLTPLDSGVKEIEMNALVRQWASLSNQQGIPNALVLRSDSEGASPLALRFFGNGAADPAQRPRLRITYTPSQVFGRP